MNNEPLIYTTEGNIPVSQLRYETLWDDCPDYTKFTERYYLGEKIVKESAHVYARKTPFEITGEQGGFNG